MSAGVCGKRVGFEEIFGSSSTSSKRSRCSTFGSPVRSSDFGSGSDDSVSVLLQMFPNLDREVCFHVLSLPSIRFLNFSFMKLMEWIWSCQISSVDAIPFPLAVG
ncbi:hypothetical protein CK203_033622 [Vitis vinifera]|uniref:Uncharacterized protein n=1 Tax=Vitis vinifera TaxID=29760 RepID=A0A438HSF0_VITVI|nr:hypothetical protein CK203_033622 [Vitis vinifera]